MPAIEDKPPEYRMSTSAKNSSASRSKTLLPWPSLFTGLLLSRLIEPFTAQIGIFRKAIHRLDQFCQLLGRLLRNFYKICAGLFHSEASNLGPTP